ncbi:hypothetical protein [Nocardioides sp. L-11A]|uniref:hypothetical protein n=1 Tax=Nocardioides sp. L-11A TaxID=3043848 RepID=UPI00249C5BE7|nr:hypothetical protein QJ852_00690 [Nocardioides sp. L-11A]
MGWKDIAKLGRDWAEAKKTELLTTDNQRREQAQGDLEEIGRASQQETVTSFLEGVLPEEWSRHITAARPENVAAREAAAQAQASADRRERLTSQPSGRVRLAVSGEEQGTLDLDLPVTVEERPAGEPWEGGPDPIGWLLVRVESAEPVALGGTTLSELSLAVPAHTGPGRYDLVELMRRGDAGEIEGWEVLDLYLAPSVEADDTVWYVDLAAGSAWIEVDAAEVRFELPLRSAVSAIRVRGSVAWG